MSNNSLFWLNKPSELLNKHHIFEIWPVPCMTKDEKLNAITRLILILSVSAFIFSGSYNIVFVGCITLASVVLLHYMKLGSIQENSRKINEKEGFVNPDLYQQYKKSFTTPTSINPLGNVLLTDIEDNPNKKPSPPSYNQEVEQNINEAVKDSIVQQNPGNSSIREKLFSDLGDSLVFEQSMRNFYSTANSTIPNDQDRFAQFCYGDMISCKEGNEMACARHNTRYTNL